MQMRTGKLFHDSDLEADQPFQSCPAAQQSLT
jgi:hypothetical protein